MKKPGNIASDSNPSRGLRGQNQPLPLPVNSCAAVAPDGDRQKETDKILWWILQRDWTMKQFFLLGLETLRYFSINKLTASVIYNEHHPPAAGCVSLEGAVLLNVARPTGCFSLEGAGGLVWCWKSLDLQAVYKHSSTILLHHCIKSFSILLHLK